MTDEELTTIKATLAQATVYPSHTSEERLYLDAPITFARNVIQLATEVERLQSQVTSLVGECRASADDQNKLRAELLEALKIMRAVATSNPYGSWLPPVNRPAGVVCRWCMERAYTPAEVQHDVECTWQRTRVLLGLE